MKGLMTGLAILVACFAFAIGLGLLADSQPYPMLPTGSSRDITRKDAYDRLDHARRTPRFVIRWRAEGRLAVIEYHGKMIDTMELIAFTDQRCTLIERDAWANNGRLIATAESYIRSGRRMP